MPKSISRRTAKAMKNKLTSNQSGAEKVETKKKPRQTKHKNMPLPKSAKLRFTALKDPAKGIIIKLFSKHPKQIELLEYFNSGLDERIEKLTTALEALENVKNDQQRWKAVKSETKEIVNFLLSFVKWTQELIEGESYRSCFVIEFLLAMFKSTYLSYQGVKPVFIKSIFDTLGDVLTLQELCLRFPFIKRLAKDKIWALSPGGNFGDKEIKILDSLRYEALGSIVKFQLRDQKRKETHTIMSDLPSDDEYMFQPNPVPQLQLPEPEPEPQPEPQVMALPSIMPESISLSSYYDFNNPTNFSPQPMHPSFFTMPSPSVSVDGNYYPNHWNVPSFSEQIDWTNSMPSVGLLTDEMSFSNPQY